MTAEFRRNKIVSDLGNTQSPISAGALAARYQVSRQIIVGDIALLRAAGHAILATPKGYLLECAIAGDVFVEQTIACRHTQAETLDELYTIVDLGGSLVDVIVEHSIYGEIKAPLHISCRADADAFMQRLNESGAQMLLHLTDGIHLHKLRAPNAEIIERIIQALHFKHILLDDSE